MMRKHIDRFKEKSPVVRAAVLFVIAAILGCGVLAFILGAQVRFKYADRIFDIDHAPQTIYAVVLGASVDPKTNVPSIALKDRLDTAIELLRLRKVMGVVITGDDGQYSTNERQGMLDYLHANKVPDEIIFIDDAAYRTYDSCANLKRQNFHDVILISQRFHLPRALYLCNELGVNATGVVADKRWYASVVYDWIRDLLASPFAYFDVRGLTLIKKGPSI